MLIRAGASNREMIGALGVNIKLLYTLVFGLGAALAGLAGLMPAPILTVQIGMGENILILAFVVIVIGGIGSIRGAFLAAMLVGMVDTLGRAFLPDLLRQVLSSTAASTAAPGAGLDADLSADGDRAGGAAGGPVSGRPPMNGFAQRPQRRRRRWWSPACCCCRSTRTLSGNVFVLTLFTRIMIYALAAASLNLILGYGGMVSFGHAAYLGIGGYAVGILAHRRHRLRLHPVAGGARRLGAVRAGDRRAVAAHPRRLFHHDHAGLRADGLLPRLGLAALRRRRRPDHLQRSDFAGLIDLSNRVRSTISASPACSAALSDLAHRQFALRHGGAGRSAPTSGACRRSAFRPTATSWLLRHRRHHVRPRRRAARQPHRLRQPGDDVLDPLRRAHGDGDPRRHRHAVRPGARRHRFLLLEELLSQLTEHWALIWARCCC